MSNPGGGNQFGSYQIQPGYGDVQKQTQLTKAAPISGAPFAAQALNTPRRAQRGTQRRSAEGTPPQLPEAPAKLVSQDATVAQTWQQLAETPGASPLVQEMAFEAMRRTSG